jgi:hypothetical protein
MQLDLIIVRRTATPPCAYSVFDSSSRSLVRTATARGRCSRVEVGHSAADDNKIVVHQKLWRGRLRIGRELPAAERCPSARASDEGGSAGNQNLLKAPNAMRRRSRGQLRRRLWYVIDLARSQEQARSILASFRCR